MSKKNGGCDTWRLEDSIIQKFLLTSFINIFSYADFAFTYCSMQLGNT